MDRDEITFGRFQLRAGVLLRDGQPVRLGRRRFEVLYAVAAARGQILSKEDLRAQLWPGRGVEEGNLHVHVSARRKALDEKGDGHGYVVTIPGRGYRLAGVGTSGLMEAPAAPPPSPIADAVPIAAEPTEMRDQR